MKILYIASSGAPTGLYGGSVALLNMLKGVSQTENIVVAFPDKGLLWDKLIELGIDCRLLPKYDFTVYPGFDTFKQKIEFLPRFVRMLYKRRRGIKEFNKLVREVKPDLIHTNVGPEDFGHFVGIQNNIPHVWHIREYQDKDFKMHPYPSMKSFREKLHHPNNHLVSITKDIFKHFSMDANKDIVIYDGVFTEKKEVDNGVKEPYFLFTGSLKEAKGLDFLLVSYIEYIRQGGTYKLLVVGAGGPEKYKVKCLSMLQDAGIEVNVEFLGFRDDVYSLMSHASAMIVPSRFEGFGFITAEAMYNNCLVIGRNTGGTKEQFDNGLFLHGKEIGLRFLSYEELTNHLLAIERNGVSYYSEMLDRAFYTVNKLYTNQVNLKNLLSFYKKILDKK